MGSSKATTTPQEAIKKKNIAPQPDFWSNSDRGKPATEEPAQSCKNYESLGFPLYYIVVHDCMYHCDSVQALGLYSSNSRQMSNGEFGAAQLCMHA